MGYSDRDGAVPACAAAEVRRMIGLVVTYQAGVSVESWRRTAGVSHWQLRIHQCSRADGFQKELKTHFGLTE